MYIDSGHAREPSDTCDTIPDYFLCFESNPLAAVAMSVRALWPCGPQEHIVVTLWLSVQSKSLAVVLLIQTPSERPACQVHLLLLTKCLASLLCAVQVLTESLMELPVPAVT